MIGTMGKKKSPKAPGRQKPTISFTIEQPLLDELDAWLKGQELHTDRSAAICRGIRMFLDSKSEKPVKHTES